MKNYQEKAEYICKRQNYSCAIYETNIFKYEKDLQLRRLSYNYSVKISVKITDLHHRLHNTKVNRKKYPLFINSLLNLVGVSNALHLQYPSALKITDMKAERYERFLERHSKIAKWVNDPEEY